MEQKMVGHFLKWWAQAYQTEHRCHLGSILYLHTGTDTCMHICILTADYTVKPVLSSHIYKEDQLSLNAGQSIAECSKGSILQSFWPSLSYHFFFFFEWLLKTGFNVLTINMYFLFCGVCRLTVRWISFQSEIFLQFKRMGPLPWKVMGHILKSWDNDPGPPLIWRPASPGAEPKKVCHCTPHSWE